jgi:hypothetical protein
MQYLKIVSKSSTTPTDMFTLGVSTSRGKDDKIGQFGSGSLMGTLAWIRAFGEAPVFILNGVRVEFDSRPVLKGDGEAFHQVTMNGQPLSVALEYGELDWKDPELGLREWICNAIDAGADIHNCLQIVDKVSAASDEVAVFVPFAGIAKKYYQNIDKYFLHFCGKEKIKYIEKNSVSKCRIYRRGIFIRELEEQSLYDYNMDFDINECRTGSSDSIVQTISYEVVSPGSATYAETVFLAVLENKDCIEVTSDLYDNLYGYWKTILTDKTVQIRTPNLHKENCIPVRMHWYSRLVKVAPHIDGLLTTSSSEILGYKLTTAKKQTREIFDNLCSMVEMLNLNAGHGRPNLEIFSTDQGHRPKCFGYYDRQRQTVAIWDGCPSDANTIAHELGHHYTKADDFSTKFIDFGYELFAKIVAQF